MIDIMVTCCTCENNFFDRLDIFNVEILIQDNLPTAINYPNLYPPKIKVLDCYYFQRKSLFF